ncbi:MAG: DNA mismatch repair endonuclease MutL [Clostridia bacterium]|nr:DNA mismatch repair endonuclease MutL [Clostridia bacterium]
MGNIVLLDEQTINKIAAGEVVDRPSSIVKELVENSIDAKATAVTVEIRKGGISYIRITDNGIGFAADDVEMAFERHATSKIRKEEDLAHITSMGFRGEALASIAAISKVTLTTKSINEDVGVKVRVEAGKILSVESAPAVTGTKIEINDVFFNVPARFKFLKKDYTEAGYIEDVMIRIALANPAVSFKYINNGKTILQTSGNNDLRSIIYDLFGKEIYQNVIPIEYESNDIKVSGMIGLPSISRSTRMHQFTFINSRYIKDKTINTAIDKACEQKFAINKFAFIVLNMQIDPSHIDVNVHPAKLEVKFDDEARVFDCIYYAVRTSLERNNKEMSPFTNIKQEVVERNVDQISKDLINNGVIRNNFIEPKKKYDFDRANEKVSHNISSDIKMESISKNSSNIVESVPYDMNENKAEEFNENKLPDVTDLKEEIMEENLYDTTSQTSNFLDHEKNIEEYTSEDNVTLEEKPKDELLYKYIGQVFDTYIIIQIKEKMYIIDQHAAHERLLYEQIKRAYYSKDKQSQLLLIPILVELTSKEKEVVDANLEMFEKSGFIIEDFGDTTIKISGVPNIGYDIEYKSMFKDIIDELLGAYKTEKSEKEFRFIATLACKAAVKGNMKLDREEQISLIDDMVKLDNPFTCPHGRPTAYEITKYEIERRFLRK